MTYYPIIIPTLNRYSHFKRCVESLIACTHADKTELVIGLDYPPSEKYIDGWKKIKDYIPSITGFQKVTVFNRKYNFGAVKNSNDLREYAYKNYDAYIFTEDDNVFSPCFLDYMDKCLEKYRDDNNVLSICGYLTPLPLVNKNKATVCKLKGVFNSWGYGQWFDKQKDLEKNVTIGYQRKICSSKKNLYFLKHTHITDLFHIFIWANRPSLNRCCDYTRRIYMKLKGKYSIYPFLSLVRNKGNDGSGLNCGKLEDDWVSTQEISDEKTFTLLDTQSQEEIKMDTQIWLNDESLSKSELKTTIKLYYKYMILGYTLTKGFDKIEFMIKRVLHKIKSSFIRVLK